MYLFELAEMGLTAVGPTDIRKPTSAAEARKQTYNDGYKEGYEDGRESGLDAAKRALIQESSYLGPVRAGVIRAVQVVNALMKPSPEPDLC